MRRKNIVSFLLISLSGLLFGCDLNDNIWDSNINGDDIEVEVHGLIKYSDTEIGVILEVENEHSIKNLKELTFRLEYHQNLGDMKLPAPRYGRDRDGIERPFISPLNAREEYSVIIVFDSTVEAEATLANHWLAVDKLLKERGGLISERAFDNLTDLHFSTKDLVWQ